MDTTDLRSCTVEKVAINAVMAGADSNIIILSALDACPDFYQSPIGTLTVTPLVIAWTNT